VYVLGRLLPTKTAICKSVAYKSFVPLKSEFILLSLTSLPILLPFQSPCIRGTHCVQCT